MHFIQLITNEIEKWLRLRLQASKIFGFQLQISKIAWASTPAPKPCLMSRSLT